VWLIVASASEDRLPHLAGLERVAQVGNDSVWRKSPSAAADAGCGP